MNNVIHVASRAVIIDRDHLLMYKTIGREKEYYYLPGGHIEHAESAAETLARELCEELGYSSWCVLWRL